MALVVVAACERDRCADLEEYVKECGKEKQTMLLVNKADFLSDEYR
jgi:Tfp pilus assembly protein PilP